MAISEETPTLTDPDDAAWAAEQREAVEAYLQRQGCEHAGVSLEPRWQLPPYLAVWAVRSKAHPDAVGWWAISGDVPTDYVSAARDIRDTSDVLAAFSREWLRYVEAMSRGEHVGVGEPQNTCELAPLLRDRARMLQVHSEQLRTASER